MLWCSVQAQLDRAHQGSNKQNTAESFDRMDRNGDGVIDRDEYAAGAQQSTYNSNSAMRSLTLPATCPSHTLPASPFPAPLSLT